MQKNQKRSNQISQKGFDKFILLMLTLWYLQRKGCFNNDSQYFLTNFFRLNQFERIIKQNDSYTFGKFLSGFFKEIFYDTKGKKKSQKNNSKFGKLMIIGSIILEDDNGFYWDAFYQECLPNYVFYQDLKEQQESNIKSSKRSGKMIKNEIENLSLFNFFLIMENVTGEINEFLLGALFENIITEDIKKSTGAYYTPENICNFISEIALNSKIFPDRLNISLSENWQEFIDKLKEIKDFHEKKSYIELIYRKIERITILDPAVGSGHLLISITNKITEIYHSLWKIVRENQIDNLLVFDSSNSSTNQKIIDLVSLNSFDDAIFIIKLNLISKSIYGVDINPYAVIITRFRLLLNIINSGNIPHPFDFSIISQNINIYTGNAIIGVIDWKEIQNEINKENLEKNKIKPFNWMKKFPEIFNPKRSSSLNGFDIILGNPPYGNLLTPFEKRIIQSKYSFSNEISSLFIEKCIELNKKMGVLVFITTYAICFSKDLSVTRKKIVKNYKLCKIATFDRDKCRFFVGMTQSVSILQCFVKDNTINVKNNPYGGIYTTKMYRKMPILKNLTYEKANSYLLGNYIGAQFDEKHRLPKIGESSLVEILEYLKKFFRSNSKKSIKTVGDLISSSSIVRNFKEHQLKFGKLDLFGKDKEDIIWFRISGNYWYNAWNKPPYYGSQIAFARMLKNHHSLKQFLLILINSSFYYVWFRIYSDGRHMNFDIMKNLVLPDNLMKKLDKYGEIIEIFASFLMQALFNQYDSEHRRFTTSKIKNIIDISDMIIGKIYGFPIKIISFIQSFEPEVRGGKKISLEIETKMRHILNEINGVDIINQELILEFEDILKKLRNKF